MPPSDDNHALLGSIHDTLMQLVGSMATVKQSIEHVSSELKEYKEEQSGRVNDALKRIETLEKQRIADKASWKGPKTLVTAFSAMITVVVGFMVMIDKFGG